MAYPWKINDNYSDNCDYGNHVTCNEKDGVLIE